MSRSSLLIFHFFRIIFFGISTLKQLNSSNQEAKGKVKILKN